MAEQFSLHPKVNYRGRSVRDFTRHARVFPIIREDDAICADYFIEEGETSHQLAQDFYGDPRLFWVILNLNDIVDPWFDWPMEYIDLIRYTEEKYGVPDIYETAYYGLGEFWYASNRLGDALLKFPQFATEEDFQAAATPMSYIEYESMMNDEKRAIRVIRPDEINRVLNDYRDQIRR